MARRLTALKNIQGLDELLDNVDDLVVRVTGDELQQGLGQIAAHGEWLLKQDARDAGWPQVAIDSTFTYAKLPPEKRKYGPSALFGFRKRGKNRPYAPGYVEWGKLAGKLVGESLVTMFEFGTSKMSARPVARRVASVMRATYPADLEKILKGILSKYQK